MRKRNGYLVPYEKIQVESDGPDYLPRLYVKQREAWPQFELCGGFLVELYLILSQYTQKFISKA